MPDQSGPREVQVPSSDIAVEATGDGVIRLRVDNIDPDTWQVLSKMSPRKGDRSWIFGPPPCDEGIIILLGCGDEVKPG